MTAVLKNSGVSPRSDRVSGSELIAAGFALTLLAVLTGLYTLHGGFILYYGDAQAHLNISRSIIDSRTPGYDQLGTVWLPLLHLLCLPLSAVDSLWSTGLAGTIPVGACFVIAGLLLYSAAKAIYCETRAATVVLACFALNPNLLYFASIPMTEVVFLAGLTAMLYAMIRFRQNNRGREFWLGVGASWWMSLTRYDGWFLIPFSALWFGFWAKRNRGLTLVAFGILAALAPAYWIAHNWYETGNALDFYNGPYSASAIQGSNSYPGYHDWKLAISYYAEAGRLCAGLCLSLLGLAGLILSGRKDAFLPVVFLLLPPLFYIWSIHSSNVPVFVPRLSPHSYYNIRYGIVLIVWAAFASGALVTALPIRWRKLTLALPLLALCPWILHPVKENVICWKESQVNSVARRAWTTPAANFFRSHYTPGQGIIAPFGDLIGVFCYAKIPLKDVLHIGNGPEWFATTSRPDLVHRELWAMAQHGDALSNSLQKRKTSPYELVRSIEVPKAQALLIFRKENK